MRPVMGMVKVLALAGFLVLLVSSTLLAMALKHADTFPFGLALGCVAGALAIIVALVLQGPATRAWHARQDAELSALLRGGALEARARYAAWLFVALVALAAGVTAAWLAPEGDRAVALTAVVFLLLGAGLMAKALARATRRTPVLRMDGRGLEHSRFGRIGWDQIVGMQLEHRRARHGTYHYLHLGVRDPWRYLQRAPAHVRAWQGRRLADGARYGALTLPLSPLDRHGPLVHKAAWLLRQRDTAPFLPSWHRDMTSAEAERALGQGPTGAADAHRHAPPSPGGVPRVLPSAPGRAAAPSGMQPWRVWGLLAALALILLAVVAYGL